MGDGDLDESKKPAVILGLATGYPDFAREFLSFHSNERVIFHFQEKKMVPGSMIAAANTQWSKPRRQGSEGQNWDLQESRGKETTSEAEANIRVFQE